MNAAGLPTTEDEIVWPTDVEVRRALDIFAGLVRGHYAGQLRGLYLFGSRARGDHRPMSDADVAVVLADGDWIEWRERRLLSRLAYEPSFDVGILIQPWPVPASKWVKAPVASKGFVSAAYRDAQSLRAP